MRLVGGDVLVLVAASAPVIAAALAGVWLHEGRRRGPRRTPSAAELAVVAGGDDRALLAALAALRRAGAIHALEGGLLQADGALPDGADRLQRAVHEAARANRELAPPHRGGFGHGFGWHAPREVSAAILGVQRSARRAGWIVAQPGGLPIGRGCLAAVGVALLGAAYVGVLAAATRVWGLGEGFFGGPVPTVLLVAFVVLAFYLSDVPTRTRSGERLLREARERHRHLAPGAPVGTPEEAALSVALGGAAALQALDPEFARRIGVRATATGPGTARDGGAAGDDTQDSWPSQSTADGGSVGDGGTD
jgi:uncharacterized protein (TIGR04222 family)